ncbi:MAG: hypothetical protein ACLFRV_06985, partial [Acidimicrobiales bacterium]
MTVTCETSAYMPHSGAAIDLVNGDGARHEVVENPEVVTTRLPNNHGRQAGIVVEVAALAPFWARAVAEHLTRPAQEVIDACTALAVTDRDGVAVVTFGDEVAHLVEVAWQRHHVHWPRAGGPVNRSSRDHPPDWRDSPVVSHLDRGGGSTGNPLVGQLADNAIDTRFVPVLDDEIDPDGPSVPGNVNVPPVGRVTARMPGSTVSWPVELVEGEDRFGVRLAVDPATVVVGHTTATSARLWIRLHDALPDGWECRLWVRATASAVSGGVLERINTGGMFDETEPGPLVGPLVDLSQSPDTRTGLVRLDDLAAGSTYRYVVAAERTERPSGIPTEATRFVLETGSFRTRPSEVDRLDMAFGSCHGPMRERGPAPDLFWAWEELGRLRPDLDRVLLLGDQIYGDEVAGVFGPVTEIVAGYSLLYDLHWDDRRVREVLKAGPTYMVPDDHDVDDDWGTVPDEEHIGGSPRMEAGVEAIRIFQRWHGPNGRDGDSFYRV